MSGCRDYPGYRGCPSAYPGFWTLVRGLPDDANCYFEALDVDDARFRPLPMALTATYMKPVAREFRVAYTRDLSDSSKPDWLLAAWGAWNANLESSPHTRDRASARDWADAQVGQPWLHRRRLAPAEWWTELPRHRFLLNPSGLGMQSAKAPFAAQEPAATPAPPLPSSEPSEPSRPVQAFEALLVGTIPICHASNAAYRKLKSEGWPLVVVHDWANVTRDALAIWWAELAPAARRMRHLLTTDRLYAMLLSGDTLGSRLGMEREAIYANARALLP